MFETASIADQQMMFQGCIVLVKNKFVYVITVRDNGWLVKTLRDGKQHFLTGHLKDVSPPYARLGMVNFPGGAVYVKRVPQRLYRVGYSNENVKVDYLPLRYDERALIRWELESTNVYDCLKNKYPSLETAINESKLIQAPIAFDKQFAVDARGDVCFKTTKVGKVKEGQVVFSSGNEYLELLLGDINGKDLRNSK